MPNSRKRVTPSRAEVRAQWNAYLAALPPEPRRVVRRLLTEIRTLAPTAVPIFSYRIPGYRLHDSPLLWVAGFSRHVGLYPITGTLQRTHTKALAGYKKSTGTVQIPLDRPVPLTLVRQLIKGRMTELRLAGRGTKG